MPTPWRDLIKILLPIPTPPNTTSVAVAVLSAAWVEFNNNCVDVLDGLLPAIAIVQVLNVLIVS